MGRRRTSTAEPGRTRGELKPRVTRLVHTGKQCSPRQDALKRLKLPLDTPVNPLITQAIRFIGSREIFMAYVRNLPDYEELVQKYDRLSASDRRALTLGDVCLACQVDFGDLLGKVTGSAFRHNSDLSKLLAAVSQPKVVEATVKSATTYLGPDGLGDRKMLLQHSNFVPLPKGAQTIIPIQVVNNSPKQEDDDDEDSAELPSFESDMIAFSESQREQRQLPATVEGE